LFFDTVLDLALKKFIASLTKKSTCLGLRELDFTKNWATNLLSLFESTGLEKDFVEAMSKGKESTPLFYIKK